MASAEQQTKDVLVASAGVLALVPVGGIFPDEVGNRDDGTPYEITDTTPAIVFERVDSTANYTLNGELHSSLIKMSVTVWAKSRAKANAVALAVTNAMQEQQNWQVAADSAYEPELQEYAAIRTFDVWELD